MSQSRCWTVGDGLGPAMAGYGGLGNGVCPLVSKAG